MKEKELVIQLPVQLNKIFYVVINKSIFEYKLTRRSLIEDIYRVQELFKNGFAFTSKKEARKFIENNN